MDKTFCEVCRKENVNFRVEIDIFKSVVKGKEYVYTGLKGVCGECGNEVYVRDLEEENLKLFNRLIGRLENEK